MAPRGSEHLDDKQVKSLPQLHKQPASAPGKMTMTSNNHSSSSKTSEGKVDPRVTAAALKKKLLKDRNAPDSHDTSSAQLGKVSHHKIPHDKRSCSDTSATRAFVPHTVARMPTQISVDADAEDITALIRSISSAQTSDVCNDRTEGSAPIKQEDVPTTSNAAAVVPSCDAGVSAPSSVKTFDPSIPEASVSSPATYVQEKEGQAANSTLAKVVAEDADLRDWLLYTHYYDIEGRNKKLARYRALAEMDEAERRIREEQERLAAARRKLLEEDALDRRSLPLSARLGNSKTPQTPQRFTPATSTSTVAQAMNPAEESKKGGLNGADPIPQKRQLSTDDAQEQRAKMLKLDTKAAGESKRSDSGGDGPRVTEPEPGRDPSRRQTGHPRRSPSLQHGEAPRPHLLSRSSFGRYDDYCARYANESYAQDDRRHSSTQGASQYDSYRGTGTRGGWARSPSPHSRRGLVAPIDPKPIDLGGKGETRFFIVKSFNEENVAMCMEDGLWMTQTQNAEVFTTAFSQCRNVVLFFSINKSKAFQGYARMATAPSPDTPRPRWARLIHWKASPPFRVEWLSTTEVEFRHVHQLRNRLNDDLPVLIGMDGQEIEEECGRKLLEQMERITRYKNGEWGDREPAESPPRESHGRGGLGVRGRGSKYVKHDER